MVRTDGYHHTTLAYDAYRDYLRNKQEVEGDKPTAMGTPCRASEANGCSRAIGLRILGAEQSDPPDDTTLIAFWTGQNIHELVQEAMVAAYEMRTEQPVSLEPLGYPISGHVDGVYTIEESTFIFELKTKKVFPIKLARSGQDPDDGVTQAAMYAMALDADYIHICYISKDNSEKPRAANAVLAGETVEWVYHMDEPFPGSPAGLTPREIATAEAQRMKDIALTTYSQELPQREIPGYGIVYDVPEPGTPLGKSGSGHWRCHYCNYWGLCDSLPYEQTPLENLLIAGKGRANG